MSYNNPGISLQRQKTSMKPSSEKPELTSTTSIPEAKRAAMPLAALMSWLEGTHHREIILEACTKNLAALCKSLDQAGIVQASNILLEVHHHPRKLTDISIFGGKELLGVPGIVCPGFAGEWGEYLEGPSAMEHFPPNLIAEFDHKENGYEMMGFFQRCSKQEGGIEAVVNAIRMYAETSISKKDACEQKELQNLVEDLLRQTMEQLGSPDYIGFVDRGKRAVKLIISISQEDLPKAATFLRQQCSAILPREIEGAGGLERFLHALLSGYELVRTSIDFELTVNNLNDKLAFECFPRRSHKSVASLAPAGYTEEDNGSWNSHLLEECFHGYKESLALACKLPYGQKRPAANLIDEELLSLQHMHRKFMLTTNCLTVKDYILLGSLPVLMNPERDAGSSS
jgi:hypothetical protein